MGNIIRTIVEILIITSMIVMGISTGFIIMNGGGDDIEFVVDNQTYTTNTAMDFSSVTVDSNFIKFNDTGFFIDCSNTISIILSYIKSDISIAVDGDIVVSFSADTTSGKVWFNLSGFLGGTSYLVKRDNVDFITLTANGSGYISFSNDVWSSHTFDIYQEGDSNSEPAAPFNPTPSNGATDRGISTNLIVFVTDPDSDVMDVSFYDASDDSVIDIDNNVASGDTATATWSGLSYGTSYSWYAVANDGVVDGNPSSTWSFTTEFAIDEDPPAISNINLISSNPIDTVIGWINITCQVSDNVEVEEVWLNLTYADSSIGNISMQNYADGLFYYNSTYSKIGINNYHIFAIDTSSNYDTSPIETFTIYANWDVNNDGTCNNLDLIAISNAYGTSGVNGWTREDVDNNGFIQVLDLSIASSHFGDNYDI